VWNHIISAWKKIVKNIELLPSSNASEVLSTSIWWSTNFIGSNFHFSIDRARVLARAGLRSIGDLWDANISDFKTWETISIEFPFTPMERHHWFFLISQIPQSWHQLLSDNPSRAFIGD